MIADATQNLKDLKHYRSRVEAGKKKSPPPPPPPSEEDDEGEDEDVDEEPVKARQWKKPPARMPLPKLTIKELYKPENREFAELKYTISF
jgi:hypothetical protein